jgi:hypothetical protein
LLQLKGSISYNNLKDFDLMADKINNENGTLVNDNSTQPKNVTPVNDGSTPQQNVILILTTSYAKQFPDVTKIEEFDVRISNGGRSLSTLSLICIQLQMPSLNQSRRRLLRKKLLNSGHMQTGYVDAQFLVHSLMTCLMSIERTKKQRTYGNQWLPSTPLKMQGNKSLSSVIIIGGKWSKRRTSRRR